MRGIPMRFNDSSGHQRLQKNRPKCGPTTPGRQEGPKGYAVYIYKLVKNKFVWEHLEISWGICN